MGPRFDSRNLPFATQFFRHVASDTEEAVAPAKEHFDRPRPFVVDHNIKPVLGRPGGPSYPSGHATFAYVDAILLAQMEPAKAAAIFARADQYSYAREVGGVHYPTDLRAGQISASVIANVLLHQPRFLADLNRAKAEVRHVTESRQ
jgi:acid phosphatase (class A)